MRTQPPMERDGDTSLISTLKLKCRETCRQALTLVTISRERILTESRQILHVPERLLRLALNEAEALAWETGYPHLVFPTLAIEKAQALARWNLRQQTLRGYQPPRQQDFRSPNAKPGAKT